MTALQIIAALLALVWLGSLTAVAACIVLDRRNDEAWEVERPEWADDPTPLYDRMVCEAIEREEWSA